MTMMKRTFAALVGLSLALVPAIALSATKTVEADTSEWVRSEVTLERGDSVKWTNPRAFDSIDHNVRAYGGGWRFNKDLPVGTSVSKRFRAAGTYKFRCKLHSYMEGRRCRGMCGVVRVKR